MRSSEATTGGMRRHNEQGQRALVAVAQAPQQSGPPLDRGVAAQVETPARADDVHEDATAGQQDRLTSLSR